MRDARRARGRGLLWPVLAATWLGLASITVFGDDEGHAPSAGTREDAKPAEVEAPTDGERLEPPRGIRPPWREPLIPEQRRGPERKHRPRPA